MRETRLESVLSLRGAGLPAPVAAYLVARVADAIVERPRIVSLDEVRVREDGAVKLARRDEPPRFDYRAPEVAHGAAGDPRAAVFSLGVLLVHAALGRSPFARATDVETRLAVGEAEVPRLTGRAGMASPPLDAIVAAACAKAAARRLPSPGVLRDALDGYLDDELHVVGPEVLAAAVREAIERAPSHDRASLPDYDDVELDAEPRAARGPRLAEPALDQALVRLGDPLLGGAEAGITEAALTGVRDSGPRIERSAGLDIDERVIAREEQARAARTRAPAAAEASSGPNWIARVAIALVALVALAAVYRLVLRPLLFP
ncbi:MAG: hypothetical protein KF729_38925 [Sandaracinaceae bacterium]|nr:hypothetical protein [Sandaracinaceae bacterium]